jgi:hypothetical protein
MRKSLKLLMAVLMVVSPEMVDAMPIGNVPAIQAVPGDTLVQKVEVIRRHGTTVHRGPAGGTAVRRSNTTVRRGPAGNTVVRRNTTVVGARPYRPWVRRPYYGTVVAGVALGTVVAVTAAATAPRAPSSNLCWYWSNSAQTRGYWDYCR